MARVHKTELEGKTFFQKWKLGLKHIDSVQLLKSKVVSHWGMFFALVASALTFFATLNFTKLISISNVRGFGIFIFLSLMAYLQVVEIIQTSRKIDDLQDDLDLYKGGKIE